MDSPNYQDVVQAGEVVHRHLRPTLLCDWPLLSQRLGFEFLLKHENHLPTGAFKVRGGINLVSRLSEDDKRRGVIGCSTGNHGQSLGLACREFGVKCVVVVPEKSNPGKLASMRAQGVELVEHGIDFENAKQHCEQLARKHGYRYVHSANEPHLIAGVGTMALEIFDDVPDPDVILVPIGLGSGVCGNAIVAAVRNPRTRVIGVQSVGAPAVAESWKRGELVTHDAIHTFAEGLATRSPAEMTLTIMRQLVSDIVLVDDDEIREAMRWILDASRNLPEPAGAATTAAAWKLRHEYSGKQVVGVLSGGNCDLRLLSTLFSNGK